MEQMSNTTHKYLRPKKTFPNVWCPGCGIGIAMGALIRAIDNLGLDKNNVAVVSGIGCSSNFPHFLGGYGLHTIHGRGVAVAEGVKISNPDYLIVKTFFTRRGGIDINPCRFFMSSCCPNS